MALTRLPSFTLLDTDSFTFANITLTSNVNANNANLGNAVTANYFIGSAANLSSIPGANVTGQVSNSALAGTVYTNAQPNITSVGTLTSLAVTGNITSGNANLGNSVVANFFTGNGHYLTSLLGSQVAGEVAYANLANSVAGANVTGTVASATVAASANSVAAANITGTINLANYATTANSVAGANVTGFVANANVANTAYSVAVANVSGIGNIATLNKDGNASNILYGNGVFASAPVTYSNSNVANYLPTHTGSITGNSVEVTGEPITNSAYFNESSYVVVPGTGILGSGDYTIEFWLKTNDSSFEIFASEGGGLAIFISTTNFYYQWGYGQVGPITIPATSILNNAWHHVALVRNSNNVTVYFDGVAQATTSNNTDYSAQTANYNIGYGNQSAGRYLNGYLSNFRIVNGTAVYTSAFTVPAGPLTAITNTTLLTFQDLTLVDNSSSTRALSVSGSLSYGSSVIPFAGYGLGGTITATGNIVASKFFVGNGSALTSLTGANVTGFVPNANIANTAYSVSAANITGTINLANYATTANAVAVANVTGIGNIATVNIDGNSSNILYGNGVFASAPVTYGNSNVASYLASFGSNVINTTGNITAAYFNGDGSNISNVNAVSLNGHSDTYFASTTYVNTAIANLVASAPAALDTLNELAAALGNDASYSSTITNSLANKLNSNAFTYANLTGTPTLGNIASLNIDGNSGNILYGNGVFSSAPVTYNDSNVATYLPNYSGNLTPGKITIAPANLNITGGTANYVLQTDGAGNVSWAAQSASGVSNLANLSDVTFANLASGDILSYDSVNSKWINTINAGGTGSASSQYVTRTATGDGSTVAYTVSTGATTNSVIVTLSGIVQTPTSDYSISGTTLTFTSAPANGIAIQIREIGIPMSSGSNTQLLFNDAGSISGTANLTFNKTTGMLTAAKLTTTSANLGSAANLKITGGNVGDLLATVGNGVLAWANVAANGNVIINGSVGGGGASVTVSDTAPTDPSEGDLWLDSESGELNVYFGSAWASVTESAGQLDIQVNNFTGDGIQSDFTLSVTPASSSYTIVTIGGITQPRTFYTLSGSTLSFGSAPPANTPIEITVFGGTASPIGLAGSVTSNAQPNITSVGTLTTLVVSGNATTGNVSTGNITVTANATVGNLKTDHLLYANGAAYVFTTNAAGSNTQIQFNNSNSFAGSANLTFNNTTNTLSVTNLVTTSANLGAIGNVKITGGSSGQALVTDGAGNLSFGSAGMSAAKVVGYNLVFGG